jgi:hypothetical protein
MKNTQLQNLWLQACGHFHSCCRRSEEAGWKGDVREALSTRLQPPSILFKARLFKFLHLSVSFKHWIKVECGGEKKIEVIDDKKSEIWTMIMGRNVKDVCPPFETRTGSSCGNLTQTHGQVHTPKASYHTFHTSSSSYMFPPRMSSELNYTAYSRTVPYIVLQKSDTDNGLNGTVCLIWRHAP